MVALGSGTKLAVSILIIVVVLLAAFLLINKSISSNPTNTNNVQSQKPSDQGQIRKVKAAFIYVGPIGDYGWSHAHHLAAQEAAGRFSKWLQITEVEKVKPSECAGVIEQLVSKGYNVIFTTSFDFMDPTLTEAKKHPNVLFFHCSGYKRYKNMGTYFLDLYQAYYLDGLMAGALSKTKKIGYVAAHTIPEVVRHINAFAIGVKETCPECKVYVKEIGAWFDPNKAREAAESLIAQGCDVLAFTEDSPTVVQVAEEHYQKGQRVLVFGHYSPMYKYGPDVCVSGQIAHWDVIYNDILSKVYSGFYNSTNLESVDYWDKMNSGAVELGCKINQPINPKFIPELKKVRVNETIQLPNGTVLKDPNVYTLVMARLVQMGAIWTGHGWRYVNDETFDPFTGPIYDNTGKLRVLPGQRLGHDALWSMQWWVENVVGPPLSGG